MKKVFSSIESACSYVGINVPRNKGHNGTWIMTRVTGHGVGNGSGRVYMFADTQGGIAYNWITGEKAIWYEDSGRTLTKEELSERRKAQAEAQAKADAERLQRYKDASDKAQKIYDSIEYMDLDHPYLKKKFLSVYLNATADWYDIKCADVETINKFLGFKLTQGGTPIEGMVLIVPIRGNVNGKIWSLQFIDSQGRKTMLPGGMMKGNAWCPLKFKDWDTARDRLSYGTIGIAEGVATAISVRSMYGCYTLAAMCCSNLKNVALSVKKLFPDSRVIIFGDKGNGENDAFQAASVVHGECRIPEFSDNERMIFEARTLSNKPTDFNDLMVAMYADYQD